MPIFNRQYTHFLKTVELNTYDVVLLVLLYYCRHATGNSPDYCYDPRPGTKKVCFSMKTNKQTRPSLNSCVLYTTSSNIEKCRRHTESYVHMEKPSQRHHSLGLKTRDSAP